MFVLQFFSCSKEKDNGCPMYGGKGDQEYNTNKGSLTDASLALFPSSIPATAVFKNNLGFTNLLSKSTLQKETRKWTDNKVYVADPCFPYFNIYTTSVNIESIVSIPFDQPNFYHYYSRTRHVDYFGYLNVSSKVKIDSSYEIITTSIRNYRFLIPIGKTKNLVTNYKFYDTITISGTLFNNIYHIYSDSEYYNFNKVIPQGIYYNESEGLVGYYLSNGELWVRQ
ncbi:MAG: hypothetical protein Q8M15_12310 [Bacteroidota bacterium]|nr:hypothetical protein [Bacteroidota bacterium]